MVMDLDTEDRVDLASRALNAFINLCQNADVLAVVKPGDVACILTLISEEFDRALPRQGRHDVASNDRD